MCIRGVHIKMSIGICLTNFFLLFLTQKRKFDFFNFLRYNVCWHFLQKCIISLIIKHEKIYTYTYILLHT